MGDIADQMLDGTLCEGCGIYLSDNGPGYPCYCDDCEGPGQEPVKREHHCHWPGCKKDVPPKFWGCGKHWRLVPKKMQKRIWHHYKPGQEDTMKVSEGYLKVAREILDWVLSNGLEEPE